MNSALSISVRFLEGRYHGSGSWPPEPARLYQALVAGAAEGGTIPPHERAALEWLESLDEPPTIAAPPARAGQRYRSYVPNNDLDAKGGDPGRTSEIRVPKEIGPQLFDHQAALLYCWRFREEDMEHAGVIAGVADRLYQLGRGIDMAWASAELLEVDTAVARLDEHVRTVGGSILRPAERGGGTLLACATMGSLQSLERRYEGMRLRFRVAGTGRKAVHLFSQAPKPRFGQVAYAQEAQWRLYELRSMAREGAFSPWPVWNAPALTELVRDKAAARLGHSLPDRGVLFDRVFGRVKELNDADKAARIRIIPLPSIGHPHAESSIRRVLVEVPPACPLPAPDLDWAFSGLHLGADPTTGEVLDDSSPMLVRADDWRMCGHYGLAQHEDGRVRPSRVWRTRTPAALPDDAQRRRIDPLRITEEAKNASERIEEERHATRAVLHALRHAGVATPVEQVRVQREPFHARDARAEKFASGTRFSKHRLWHVEITFEEPRQGPLVIGDGRYLGLGLMAPERQIFRSVMAFTIESAPLPGKSRAAVLQGVRRALMALDRDLDPRHRVSMLFSGHEPDGSPAGSGSHEHVFLAAETEDGADGLQRIYVIRPDEADHKAKLSDAEKARFERVATALRTVRAGPHGTLKLRPLGSPASDDRLFTSGRTWRSLTEYYPTRHPRRRGDVESFLVRDVQEEAFRRGLPRPVVEVISHQAGPRGGLRAELRLTFSVAVPGPLLLGTGAHKGEGAFITEV